MELTSVTAGDELSIDIVMLSVVDILGNRLLGSFFMTSGKIKTKISIKLIENKLKLPNSGLALTQRFVIVI